MEGITIHSGSFQCTPALLFIDKPEKKKIKKSQETPKSKKMRKQYIHHGTTSHFGLCPFLTKVFFIFLLSLGFYRGKMWCNCHLHSSSHQRILTDDKVTEAVIDDLGGSFFFFFQMTVHKCSHSENRMWATYRRERLRYKVVAQNQFTSLGTTGSSEEPSTRQRLQRGGASQGEIFIKKKLYVYTSGRH